MRQILSVNGGSSSIKFALFDAGSLQRVSDGDITRIGLSGATFREGASSRAVPVADYGAAIELLMQWAQRQNFSAVGHRIVHGGPKYIQPEKISEEMVGQLRLFTPFDPEHLPEEIALVEAFFKKFPKVLQVACFDTAFHAAMPRLAQLLPIPRRYGEKGVRRYGFHGLSYAFLMGELERLGEAKGRVILAHLGSGASLVAVQDGKSIDTTMGFTPTGGVMMGSRSGDLDPGLVSYLAQVEGIDANKFREMVNFESGLLGVSGISSDVRDLLDSKESSAEDAIALFCYQVKKTIGAFAALLGGVDTLVFSGGIGENCPSIRSRICEGLEFLGIAKKVRVIHTDEEQMIAKITQKILG